MRNSIQGPPLRTGNNSSFKALETGYPVFKMAFQLKAITALMQDAIWPVILPFRKTIRAETEPTGTAVFRAMLSPERGN
jgi:hypothetical protein